MESKMRQSKIALIISMASIFISLAAVVISSFNIRNAIANGDGTGSSITLFFSMLAILCGNITIFLSIHHKYKRTSEVRLNQRLN